MFVYTPRDLRTHILRLLGPKTILYKAFGLFRYPGYFGAKVLRIGIPSRLIVYDSRNKDR